MSQTSVERMPSAPTQKGPITAHVLLDINQLEANSFNITTEHIVRVRRCLLHIADIL